MDGLVWKILAHPTKPILVIEVRNDLSRKTSFCAINVEIIKLLWRNDNLQNSWWLGLENVAEDIILIHGYEQLQSPLHKGITALDLKSGKQLWQNSEFIFIANNEADIYFKNFEGKENPELLKVSPKSGNIVTTVDDFAFSMAIGNNLLQNPLHITAEDNQFTRISSFIGQSTGMGSVVAIDYLEYDDHIVLSFYTKVEQLLQNHLMLVNANGKVLFCKLIEDKIKGMGKESFFIFHHFLIFVENRTEIFLYKL